MSRRERQAMKAVLSGHKDLIRDLKKIAKQSRKVNRTAVRKAVRIIRKAVKDEAPVGESGTLKKSIGEKIGTRKNGSGAVYGLVGVDMAVKGPNGEEPFRYDHLVHDGFQHANGQTVPGNPYMQRGYDKSIGSARATYERELKNGIEKVKTGGGKKK